ncbi:hypothetical protein LOD99_7518 [Oopsacas minuta]|uniref:Uncharacterized protein n=1 Tax=Oopsacas minuta TaxID=111878 RepID=A0AAV7JV81_9METZ|nr:hypothetical protein LOD99_7518 [Oopsacas minuta]
MGTRTRTEVTSEVKRRDHQKDLAKQINEDAKRRLMEGKTTDSTSHQIHSNIAYKNSEHLPSSEHSVKDLKLFVDKKYI